MNCWAYRDAKYVSHLLLLSNYTAASPKLHYRSTSQAARCCLYAPDFDLNLGAWLPEEGCEPLTSTSRTPTPPVMITIC